MAMPMLRSPLLLCLIAATAGCAADLPLVRMSDNFSFPPRGELNVEQRFVVRDQMEWEKQWRRITPRLYDGAGRLIVRPAPPLDFTREMILIAEMGLRGFGHKVIIHRVIERGTVIEAVVWQFSPGRRCSGVVDDETPTDVVRVPANSKPVRWTVMRQVRDC